MSCYVTLYFYCTILVGDQTREVHVEGKAWEVHRRERIRNPIPTNLHTERWESCGRQGSFCCSPAKIN